MKNKLKLLGCIFIAYSLLIGGLALANPPGTFQPLFLNTTSITNSGSFVRASSQYLDWTPGSTGVRTKSTINLWWKRSTTGVAMQLYSAWVNGTSHMQIGFADSGGGDADTLRVYQYNGSFEFQYVTTATYTDTTNWHQLVVAINTDLPAPQAADRIIIYVDGTRVTSFTTTSHPGLSLNTFLNYTSAVNNLGRQGSGVGYFNGLLADVYNIANLQLAPSSFASAGVPIPYAGVYATDSFHLSFSNSANMGTDNSGLGNNWTNHGVTQSADRP